MKEIVDFGLYDKVQIEFNKVKEFDYETERVGIGITGYRDLYSNEPKLKIIVMDNDYDLIEEIFISANKWMSEDGMHYFWHENLIPWFSERYDCGKYFYGTYELINILYPTTDEELEEL